MNAVVLAVVASLFWGVGTALQKQGMAVSFPRITVGGLLRSLPLVIRTLLVNRAWLIGLVGMFVGMALFGMALGRGDITVVQPVVCLTGVVAAIVGVGFLGERLGRLEWVGIGLTLLGVVLVGMGGGGQTATAPQVWPLLAFIAVTTTLALASLLLRRLSLSAELTLSLAAGLIYGLANMLGKVLTQNVLAEVGGSFDLDRLEVWASMLTDWPIFAIGVGNIAAGVFYQTAFAPCTGWGSWWSSGAPRCWPCRPRTTTRSVPRRRCQRPPGIDRLEP
jgi:drug/metabolite transporter (DMT)-like permease